MDTKKLQKLCIKDFIKDSSSQRLTSIKLPRDLSLGGTKLNKKVYKPNLNVVRNKTNIENKLREIEKPKFKQQKTRERIKPKLVQSTGVFSEGIVSDHPPIIHPMKVRKLDVQEKVNLVTPKSEKQSEINVKHESNEYEEIKRYLDGNDSDSDEKSTIKPIPWNESLFQKVKNETYPNLHSICKDFLEIDTIKSTLNLWHLPDTFNFKKDDKNQKTDYSLIDMPEGKIGKACIRKSGKVDVLIGKLTYELESSDWASFTEHLVTINIDAKAPSAAVLGNLEQRYILSPDWNCLV